MFYFMSEKDELIDTLDTQFLVQAMQVAKKLANEMGETVYLIQGQAAGMVEPDFDFATDEPETCDICGEQYQGQCTPECEKIIQQIDAYEAEQGRKAEQAMFQRAYGAALILE